MFFRILKKDLKRKKAMNAVMLSFILLAAPFLPTDIRFPSPPGLWRLGRPGGVNQLVCPAANQVRPAGIDQRLNHLFLLFRVIILKQRALLCFLTVCARDIDLLQGIRIQPGIKHTG